MNRKLVRIRKTEGFSTWSVSDWKPVLSEVSQGSFWEPFLFLV